jgi:hypothetical protein
LTDEIGKGAARMEEIYHLIQKLLFSGTDAKEDYMDLLKESQTLVLKLQPLVHRAKKTVEALRPGKKGKQAEQAGSVAPSEAGSN